MFRREISSISSLVTFEAAARLLSFTRAASELNVTQAAVSRQIRLLETRLGFKLFVRGHRKVELTNEGRTLSRTMTHCLSTISNTLVELRRRKDDELQISALVAFSNLWLTPKLSAFQRLHQDLNIRVVAQDNYANLAAGDIDVALRFGEGRWDDGEAILLFHDRLFPVASAEYIAKHPPIEGPHDVVKHHLIDSNRGYSDWIDWNDWLSALGYSGPPARIGTWYSFYTDAVSAALNGQGLLLGWNALIENHLRSGRLKRLTVEEVMTKSAHFAVIPPAARQKASVAAFVEWIRSSV
jgi:DNA-binding transcriptional LysR family regulator